MKIVVLSDNRTTDPQFESEHGLSVYLETKDYKCLLDTGASVVFIRNAEKLGIDLTEVNYVFISHGHADHMGGLPAFLKLNKKAKIILSKNVLNQRYFSERLGFQDISTLIDVNQYPDRFIFVDQETHIEKDIRVFSCQSDTYLKPIGNKTLFKSAGNDLEKDDFNHEVIVTFGDDELVVFTGCGHNGLLNILKTIKDKMSGHIRYVIGGFHLLDSKGSVIYESDTEIKELGIILKNDYPLTDFITGHCTGDLAFESLKKELKHRLIYFFAGYKLNIKTIQI
jgi:7,8-dihydropterin-6-yl-methyl-4-(beta-D-ribofuranosyl)aminobenzene 5'-phosphate synthase